MNAHQPLRKIGSDRESPVDRYSWDGSGPPDPTIARLERALAPLRYQPRAASIAARSKPASTALWRWPYLRAAAALAITIVGVWAVSLFSTSVEDIGLVKNQRNIGWKITALDGRPRVAQKDLLDDAGTVLRVGEWVETDAHSRAEIAVADIGTVTVESGSRLRLVSAHEAEHRLELARGTIDAFITAPPRLFLVDTPAGTAVDLGCAYTLSVDEQGNGVLDVTLGWVSFEVGGGSGRESIVPRGAMCVTRKGVGPGTPFYADANAALQRALEQFDFDDGGAATLSIVLSEARDRDSLTIWHLLSRVDVPEDRAPVFDRLASIQPPPEGVSRAAIMRGDAAALLRWRDAFIWSPNPPVSPMR